MLKNFEEVRQCIKEGDIWERKDDTINIKTIQILGGVLRIVAEDKEIHITNNHIFKLRGKEN